MFWTILFLAVICIILLKLRVIFIWDNIIDLYIVIKKLITGFVKAKSGGQEITPLPVITRTMINNVALYTEGAKTALYPVVFVPGLGDGHESWNGGPLGKKSIQHEIAKITYTLSYDPVGIGMSVITPAQIKPTSFKQECTQLRQLIVAAGVNFPVILVGHSIGGRIAGMYASMFPKDVAALLLVDPTPNYQFSDAILSTKVGHVYDINRNYMASYIHTYKQLPKTSPQCDTILHDRTVLDKIKANNLKQFNKSFYHDIRKHITHENEDHYIQFSNPDSIIYSIKELLGQL